MPTNFDLNVLNELINQAFQSKAQNYSGGFSLAQPNSGFSLAENQVSATNPVAALTGGKKTNWADMLKGLSVALGSLALLRQPQERMAPAASVGQKYPVTAQSPFPQRPLGFKPILGGRR